MRSCRYRHYADHCISSSAALAAHASPPHLTPCNDMQTHAQGRLEAMNEEVVPFEEIINEFMDIVKPASRGRLSLNEVHAFVFARAILNLMRALCVTVANAKG